MNVDANPPWMGRAFQVLDESATCSLATVGPEGRPHAANLNFVHRGRLELAFISSPQSAHIRHLDHKPAAAVTVYPFFQSTAQIRGLQMHGRCEQAETGRFDAMWADLVRKFPDAAAQRRRADAQRFYLFRPNWVRLIDNRKEFGWRAESAWPPGQD